MSEPTPLPTAEEPGERPAGIDWAVALVEHDRWLRTVVFARLGERQAVDEVMQEIALAAVAQHAPLSDPARLGAWLYRLAIRRVLLHRRAQGRRERLLGRYAWARAGAGAGAGDGEWSGTPDPLHWLVLDERRHLVREALARLPRRDAEILLLKYTEDWSYRELADHLGIAESAVETRLFRARRRLRSAMAGSPAIEVSES
jgi:RNA polymerase sigma-70 factor (ECF subfamily)